MFWLGFLFGDENRKLKELEQRKKDRQAELDNKTIGFMVETLTPQLEFMKKNELDNLTFPILDLSKFDYSLLYELDSGVVSLTLSLEHYPVSSFEETLERYLELAKEI